jgi:glutathione S-transferase
MLDKRIVLHTVFVLLMPVLVAGFGWSVWTALLLVLVALLWRWAIVLQGFVQPSRGPELMLETISASHFVEKVRWCMDRLGVDYEEVPWCGTLGAFYFGRTVPRLHVQTGMVRSQIGNSPEILRYLWGAYGTTHGSAAAFLEPSVERVEFERRIDRCAVSLQVWVYYHLLDAPDICKRAWGIESEAVPAWQRRLVSLLYPVQVFLMRRAFRINESNYRRNRDHIDSQLAEVEAALADGRQSILGGDVVNYTDLAFAAIHGLWLQPEGYGGGAGIRIERDTVPAPMRQDIERWVENYPSATRFIEALYASDRKQD